MLQSESDKLLRYLMNAKRYKPPMHRSKYAGRAESFSNKVMFCAAALFGVLLALAAYVYFAGNASEGVKLAGRVVGVFSMLLATGSLILMILSSIISFVRLSKDFCDDLIDQKNHDMANAKFVMSVTESATVYCQKVLELKLRRIEYRMSQFFGNGDNLALVSLGAMGWAVYKEVGQDASILSDLPTVVSSIIILALAFMLGAYIGALVARNVSYQCRYGLELIELAETLKKRG